MAGNARHQSRMFIPTPLSIYIGFIILLRGCANASLTGHDPRYYIATSVRAKPHIVNPRQVTEEERPNYHSMSPFESLAGAQYMPQTWFNPSRFNGVSDSENLPIAKDAPASFRYKKGKVYNYGSKDLPRRDSGTKSTTSYTKPPQTHNFFRLIG